LIPFLDLRAINARYREELLGALTRVVDSGWYVLGAEVEAFERQYAAFCGAAHCIGVGNGLEALTLIWRAYQELGRLRAGDQVIAPANTYIASLLAISETGLEPVLVEPDTRSFGIDSGAIEAVLGERTRAILVVHLYGRIAYDERLRRLAADRGLLLIEDGAQSCGASWSDRRSGSLGDAGAHSFFPSKNLGALGDAGAVTTDDPQLAAVVRSLRNYGSAVKYHNDYKGKNSRLDELQAAVLGVKLRHVDEENRRRIEMARFYDQAIRNPRISLPEFVGDGSHVWHLYVVRCAERDALQRHLAERGIETLIHYPVPPHRQPAYREWRDLSYPITEDIHRTVISLPLDISMSPESLARVAAACNEF
jgi:dTDP-4-amino-4,6-dideoxygalactose transaminase